MIYANDESDKQLRKKHFILYCFVIPALLIGGAILAVYFANKINLLAPIDARIGYWTFPSIGVFVYSMNKKNWLKMPDGSYYNLKGQLFVSNKKEPAVYEEEYYISKIHAALFILPPLAVLGSAFYFYYNLSSLLLPMYNLFVGFFLVKQYSSLLKTNTPRLKLAKEGIWTPKLGFRNWDEVATANVSSEEGKDQQYLLIHLHGTIFAEANQPDDSVQINNLKGYEYIETVVDTLKDKYMTTQKLVQ